jgi:hypothetical protein
MSDHTPHEHDDALDWVISGFADVDADELDLEDRSPSGGPDTSDAPLARRRR